MKYPDVAAKCEKCGRYNIPVEDGGYWCHVCYECREKEVEANAKE